MDHILKYSKSVRYSQVLNDPYTCQRKEDRDEDSVCF
jgi:hypothetical protein